LYFQALKRLKTTPQFPGRCFKIPLFWGGNYGVLVFSAAAAAFCFETGCIILSFFLAAAYNSLFKFIDANSFDADTVI
jgi:hypothetical protein